MMTNNKRKSKGQVYTPDYLVCNMLDWAGYNGSGILRRHAMDNSCGDGAFICQMSDRYCREFLKISSNRERLRHELETYIHGIEIDPAAHQKCIENLDRTVGRYGLTGCDWDILCADALEASKYRRGMDFVIGNPPYVRIHNLGDSYFGAKGYSFGSKGMTDLYLVFYELGLNQLGEGGTLCYVTPNSWINSVAGREMRNYLNRNRNIKDIVDIGQYRPFDASTYTLVTVLKKESQDRFNYYTYDGKGKERCYRDSLSYGDSFIEGNFVLGTRKQLEGFRNIVCSDSGSYVKVKNGLSTQSDDIFIRDSFDFDDMVIPMLKASTGQWKKGFYPYDPDGHPYSKDYIFSHKKVAEYLNANKTALLKGRDESLCPDWYLYGRTQALCDVSQNKVAVNKIIKDADSLKISDVPAGEGTYSGYYVRGNVSQKQISSILRSHEFMDFVVLHQIYKSSGYYYFGSRDLETFLNYKMTQLAREDKRCRIRHL